MHAFNVYSDSLDQIEIIGHQFPWASFGYSFSGKTESLDGIGLNIHRQSSRDCYPTRGDLGRIS